MYFPADQVRYGEPDSQKMCGDGRIEEVEHGPESPDLRATYVEFAKGAYTKWHFHTGDQFLIATRGTGFVEYQGLPDVPLREGDRALIPSGIWHRHGAKEGATLVHVAVTTGETVWDEDGGCDKSS